MHRPVFALLLIFQGLVPPGARAQFRFEHAVVIDKEKGLPTNGALDMCKDHDGFMWFATLDGLCRFDGSHIKTYRNNPADSTSLFENQVWCVEAYQGRIWAGTPMGVSVLDPQTEKFTHLQFDSMKVFHRVRRAPYQGVLEFYTDPWGDLWIGTQTQGAVRYRAKQHDFQFFQPTDSIPYSLFTWANNAERVISFAASPRYDTLVYAGMPTGLMEINRISGRVHLYVFPQPTPEARISANAFIQLYLHDDGLLYTGSWNAGMHVFNPADKSYKPLPVEPGLGNKIFSNPTYSILRKSASEIWITSGAGLCIYNSDAQAFTYCKWTEIENGRFFGLNFVDDDHRAWYCHISGVYIFDPCLQQIVTHDYAHLRRSDWSYTYSIEPGLHDDELVLLPRNDNAVYHFNQTTQTFQRFVLNVPGKKMPAIWPVRGGMARAPDGSYTISTELGMFSYSALTHRVRPLACNMPFKDFDVMHIFWDREGCLWISGARKGLFCWDPKGKRTRHFQPEFTRDRQNHHDPLIIAVAEDSRGQKWIRREGGYSVYLPQQDTLFNFVYTLDTNRSFPAVYSLAEDRYGRMWMAGVDGNVAYAETAHPERGIVKKFNLRADMGLADVYRLAADTNGNIWGHTLKELVSIDPDSLTITTLSFEYGMVSPEFFSLAFSKNGQLIIGGRNRIYSFDPARMERNRESPQPYVEEIQVQGKALPAIPATDGAPVLHLRHWENFFSVAFSAKAYTLGSKCRFRFRLKNFEDWQEAGSRRYANYTNVPGGQYVFQVQVANNEGIWSPRLLEMPVAIDTAWYATWWFRIGAVALALALIYGTYRYRILQIRRQERLRTAFEKQLANVEMSALLAQMNPHFLFNCLNSIDSYIIRNESKKASEYLNNFARLMRLILNNSRTNYISLKDELESLELYLQMESLRFKDKFEYEIIVDGHLDPNSINIPPMLIQPYVENAVWHGLMHKDDGQGKVTIRVREHADTLTCTVEDNGVGREKAMALKPNKTGKNRQSMGMQITKDRMEIINKLYDANTRVQIIDLYDEARVPRGTRVELTIPI